MRGESNDADRRRRTESNVIARLNGVHTCRCFYSQPIAFDHFIKSLILSSAFEWTGVEISADVYRSVLSMKAASHVNHRSALSLASHSHNRLVVGFMVETWVFHRLDCTDLHSLVFPTKFL